jgi:hypothetical protein
VDVDQGDVALTTLDAGNVGRMKADPLGEGHLRHADVLSQDLHTSAEAFLPLTSLGRVTTHGRGQYGGDRR